MPEAKQKIVLERRYRATTAELWELWTTKDGFESWWGPQGFRVEVKAIEPKNGGRLQYDMIADAPEQVAAMKAGGYAVRHDTRATFSDVVPLQRLSLVSVIDFIPGVPTYDSAMSVEFIEDHGTVRMVITQEAMPDPFWTQQWTAGMTSQLTKIDSRLAA